MIVQQTTANNNGHDRTSVQVVQKHTKNTVCYIPAFWHKSGLFYRGGYFSFFQVSEEQTSRRVPLHHTQPMLTSATAHRYRTTHTPLNRTKSTFPYPTQNPTNLIPKQFLLIFARR